VITPLAILVVDDEPAVRRALERVLTRLGHAVQVATSGEAACETLATSAVDLVLMDLRMPGMSGQTLYHSIVARWPHLVTRVIVMTGDPEAQDHHDWLRHNDLPVLTKPFELAQLEQLVGAMATEERRRSQG
jgi:CheY-like chemotaxis protein